MITNINILLYLYGRKANTNQIVDFVIENEGIVIEGPNELANLKRKIQRKLRHMEGHFGLYCVGNEENEAFELQGNVNGQNQMNVWCVDSHDFEQLISMEPSFALSLIIAEQQVRLVANHYISQRTNALFKRAKTSLERIGGHYANWHKTIRVLPASHRLKQPAIEKGLYENLLDSALKKETILFDYQRALHLEKQPIEALALGVYFRGEQVYLIAKVYTDNTGNTGVRQFPLTRITNVKHLVTSELEVGDFSLDAYEKEGLLSFLNTQRLPELQTGFTFQAEIFISVKREIEAALLGDNQKIEAIAGKENYFLLTVDVPNSLNFSQWVLARSPYMRVISPEPFKNFIQQELEQALNALKINQLEVPELN